MQIKDERWNGSLKVTSDLDSNLTAKNMILSPNFHSRKLGEIKIFYAVSSVPNVSNNKVTMSGRLKHGKKMRHHNLTRTHGAVGRVYYRR